MMVIRAEDEHIEEGQRWLAQYGIMGLPRDFFPPTTYVVPGVAMLSLYLTDSSLAFIESLVGNPMIGKAERGAGLDLVIAHALAEARAAGTKLVCGSVQSLTVEERLCRHGFEVMGRKLAFIIKTFAETE